MLGDLLQNTVEEVDRKEPGGGGLSNRTDRSFHFSTGARNLDESCILLKSFCQMDLQKMVLSNVFFRSAIKF